MSLPLSVQKEQLSFAYIYAVAAKAGFNCDSPHYDYDSVDVTIGAVGHFGRNAVLGHLELKFKQRLQLG